MNTQADRKIKKYTPKRKKENIARFGIASKGFVYCLLGVLSAMAAFGGGGKKTGSSGALQTLGDNTFGNIVLVLVTLGLLCFVFWRLYQAIADPENKGNDAKAIFRRLGYAASGVFYGFIAFAAARIVFDSGGGGGGQGKNEKIVSQLLEQSYGQILVGALALIFLGKAIYQLYRAYSGKFKDKVKDSGLDQRVRNLLLKTGRVGYTARGLVIGVIAYLTFRAAITASSGPSGGTKEAFSFLQNEFGTIVFGVIALGLVAYGIFMFVKARYREMSLV